MDDEQLPDLVPELPEETLAASDSQIAVSIHGASDNGKDGSDGSERACPVSPAPSSTVSSANGMDEEPYMKLTTIGMTYFGQ